MIRTQGIPYGVLDIRYYTKDEVNDIVEGNTFDFFLNNTLSGIGTPEYFTMDATQTGEAESTFSDTITGDAFLIDSFTTTVSEPTFTNLVAGIYSFHIHGETTVGINVKTVRLYWELYRQLGDSPFTETLLLTSEESDVLTASNTEYDIHGSLVDSFMLNASDRLVLKVYANIENDSPPRNTNPLVTLRVEGTTASHFEVVTNISAFDDRYVQVTGDSMTGNLDMGDNDIVGIDKLQSTGCTASGTDSVALGIDTTASGNWSTAIGSRTQAVGNYSTAMGDDTRALGHYSTTTGFLSIAQGWFSTASGFRTHADSYAGVAFGRYNVGGGTINSWVVTDPLFEIGIGTATDARANALTVFKNGNFDFHAGNLTTTGNLSDGTYSLTVANAWLAYFHVTSSGTSHSGVDGTVTIHSDVTNAGSGLIITDAERTNLGTAFDYSQVGHLPLAGGTMSGGINMDSNAITGSGAGHDQFSDFVSNEHIDWTSTSSSISTTGTITSGDITIFDVTPILVFKDSNGVGGAATGFIEWRDSNNTRLGTLGNGSSGTDDLNWKNESSGGHINIETTGAGKVNISANDVIMTGSLSGVVNVTATGNLSDGIESATVAELIGYSGQIQMWNGLIANIPSGWVICDGANGTPDLRDKFVRGAGAGDEAGGTGGSETHLHAVTGSSTLRSIAHTHALLQAFTGVPVGTQIVQSGTGVTVASSIHTHCIYLLGSNTESAGPSHCHAISFNSAACSTLPSYHELIFIMRT